MSNSNLRLSKSDLLDMVSAIMGAVDKKSVHPGLVFARVDIDDKAVEMTALDLEIQVVIRKSFDTPTGFSQKKSFCLPVKKIYDFIRALSDEEYLQLSVDEEHKKITVQASHCRIEVAAYNPQDFPQFEVSKPDSEFYVDSQELKNIIDAISFSMAQSDIRYYLNGMLWDALDDKLVCVATDGHRMALSSVAIDRVGLYSENTTNQPNIQQAVIIPRRAIFELNKLLTARPSRLKVGLSRSLMNIQFDDISFTSKLIDGKFPDYSRVIPREHGEKLVMSKEQLKNALVQVQPVISAKNKGVELKFLDETLVIYAKNSQGEEVTVQIQLESRRDDSSEELSLGLNLGYIYEYLQTVKNETVNFFVKSSKSGILLSHNDGTKYLVMPLTL